MRYVTVFLTNVLTRQVKSLAKGRDSDGADSRSRRRADSATRAAMAQDRVLEPLLLELPPVTTRWFKST